MSDQQLIQRPLTNDELVTIRQAIDAAESGYEADVNGVCAIYDLTVPNWRDLTAGLRPSDVKIPADQCVTIIEWATAHHKSGGTRLEAMLDVWLNKGPSTYERST